MTVEVAGIARVCHEANRAYCVVVGDPVLPGWDELEESYRDRRRFRPAKQPISSTPASRKNAHCHPAARPAV